jgi:gliding motility-associated-like protein
MKNYVLSISVFLGVLLSTFVVDAQCTTASGTIDFTLNRTRGCVPAIIRADAINVPVGSTIYWDFGVGKKLGSSITLEEIRNNGIYTVTLEVVLPDSSVCVVEKKDILDFTIPRNQDFTVSRNFFCGTDTAFTLTDLTENVARREWFVNGTLLSDTGKSINYVPTQPGFYEVGLVAYASSGCFLSLTKSNVVFIAQKPVFEVCFNQILTPNSNSVQMKYYPTIDSNSVQINNIRWFFPGGTPSTFDGLNPPIINYTSNLIPRDVRVLITSAQGCQTLYEKKEVVKPFYSINKTTSCLRFDTIIVQNLDDYTGRTGSFSFISNKPINVTNDIPNKTHRIRFLDTGRATLNILLKDLSTSCTDTLTTNENIFINPPLAVFIADSPSNCNLPDTVNFKALDSLPITGTNTYTWEIYDSLQNLLPGLPQVINGNHNFSYIFDSLGVYDVKLTVVNSNGCIDSLRRRGMIIMGLPILDYELDTNEVCDNSSTGIQVKNLNVPLDNPSNPFVHEWILYHRDSLNDSFVYRGPSPIFKPTVPGSYDVFYKVSTTPKCTTELRRNNSLQVNGTIADVVINPVSSVLCAPYVVNAVAQIKLKFPNIASNTLSYQWEVEPASDATISNPNSVSTLITLNRKGTYSLKLNIYSAVGCTTVVEKLDFATIGTSADFSIPQIACKGESYLLENLSSGNPDDFSWSVTPSTGVFLSSNTDSQPNIVFNSDGCYDIRLISKRNNTLSCNDTIIKQVCVKTPTAGFFSADSSKRCAPVQARFISTSFNAVNYFWDFGDGVTTTTTDSFVDHTYTRNNINGFTVKLVIDNGGGCNDSFIRPNYIKVLGPEPDFEANQNVFCETGLVSFNDKSFGVTSYVVDYGDGSLPITNSTFPDHRFNYLFFDRDTNTFVTRMFSLDDSNCLAVAYDTIVLYRPARPSFIVDFDKGCRPFKATFTQTSEFANEYDWDFNNDGIIDASGDTVTFTYDTSGIYSVRMFAKTSRGCINDTLYDSLITVYDLPTADFTSNITEACFDDFIQFTDRSRSTSDGPNIVKWLWKFGDGNSIEDTSTMQNPLYRYVNPGLHTVKLIIENENGCIDSIIKTDVILSLDNVPSVAPPIKFVTVLNDDSIQIEYNIVNDTFDFQRYQVFRITPDSTDFDDLVFTTTDPKNVSFVDKEPSLDVMSRTYSYRISFDDKCGLFSEFSKQHTTILLSVDIPSNILRADLSWNPYTGWDDIVEYEIYRAETGTDNYNLIGRTSDTTYSDEDLCELSYTYYVVAVQISTGYKSKSNTVILAPDYKLQLEPLEIYTVSVLNNSSIYMSWSKSVAQNVDAYFVERYQEGKGWQLNYVVTQDTFFIDTDVNPNNQIYQYRVWTIDRCGNRSEYSFLSNSILLEYNTVNDNRNFNWTEYDYWEEGILAYELQKSTNVAGTFTNEAIINATTQEFLIPVDDLLADSFRCFRIVAYRAGNRSDTSVSNVVCPFLSSRFYIPNAFTPNTDQYNPLFKPVAVSVYENENPDIDYGFKVFNRWGELIFETTNLSDGWDGTFKGKPQQEGVYRYEIVAYGLDGTRFIQTGNFHLIK